MVGAWSSIKTNGKVSESYQDEGIIFCPLDQRALNAIGMRPTLGLVIDEINALTSLLFLLSLPLCIPTDL